MDLANRFFVFDGVDGAGKSTALQGCAAHFRRQGFTVLSTREPGGSEAGEAMRELLLRPWTPPLPVESELLLIFAARFSHLQHTIAPALARGEIVLCDRFVDSSYVYQGVIGGAPTGLIDALVQQLPAPSPRLSLIFDLPAAESLARQRARGQGNRFDSTDLARLEQIRQGFLERLATQPDSHRRIDAGAGPEALLDHVVEVLQSCL